jgi:putative SOS response-associated peptidase YedK
MPQLPPCGEAIGAVAEIHDRMPLVLDEEDWPLWLATGC